MEDYLNIVKKEAFDKNDEDVILIDPEINLIEKFKDIDLLCNMEGSLNNQMTVTEKKKKKV
jgi:hypothetical protein